MDWTIYWFMFPIAICVTTLRSKWFQIRTPINKRPSNITITPENEFPVDMKSRLFEGDPFASDLTLFVDRD